MGKEFDITAQIFGAGLCLYVLLQMIVCKEVH